MSLHSEITGLVAAGESVDEIGPGGLIGVGTKLDPALTKADSLSGSVAGKPGTCLLYTSLYRRNEIYLLLSTAILLISVLLGYAFAGLLSPFFAGMLGGLKNNAVQGQIQLQTLPIFEKNLDIILIIYIGGVLFGVGTAIYLIFNGIFNGYAATQFPLGNYILYNICLLYTSRCV